MFILLYSELESDVMTVLPKATSSSTPALGSWVGKGGPAQRVKNNLNPHHLNH